MTTTAIKANIMKLQQIILKKVQNKQTKRELFQCKIDQTQYLRGVTTTTQ